MAARFRTLALDLPLALAVGVASGAAARVSEFGEGPRRGGVSRPQGGPFDRSPMPFPPDPVLVPPAAPGWPLYLGLLLVVLGVAFRRMRPRAAFLAVVIGVAVYLASGGPYGPVLIAPALAVHSLATALPVRRWAPLTLLLLPMLLPGFRGEPYLGLLQPGLYVALVSGAAVLVLPAMFALLYRSRRESERVEREQELRRYAYEERMQIAREVHDVVGHSLSVINLQAGVALHVLHRRPAEVEASLEAIKRTSREALAELRTTLAVFRDPAVDDLRAPSPGLARLEDLVAALRAAGREVTVARDTAEDLPPLPATVDQAAYRIIQEALTNVVRHADGAAATVLVRQDRSGLLLEVVDVGRPPERPLVEGSGILGMRERAEAVGGSLTVSQTATGEFRVRAELPLHESVGVNGSNP